MLRCQLGWIRDVSCSGARIRSRRRRAPAIGELILLRIRCLDLGVKAWGQVVWTHRAGLFHHEIGIRFADADPALKRKLNEIARVAVDRHLIASAPCP